MVEIGEILIWLKENSFEFIIQKEYDKSFIIEKPEIHSISKENNISFTKKENESNSGIVFCSSNIKCGNSIIKISSNNPRLDFIKCISHFF